MSSETPTIAQALASAAQRLAASSTTARLDAELLLGAVLGWRRAQVLAEGRHQLTNPQYLQFTALIERRAALEPVAYLLGQREFYGLDFIVTPAVLVPRPETELLVDVVLRLVASWRAPAPPDIPVYYQQLSIADIGTGSGAIAVALATHLPDVVITAVDLSPEALVVAAQNVAHHGLAEQVQLAQGDLLAPLAEPVDMIVSNPPYTVLAEIDEGVRRYEPHLALDGGPDGLASYRRLWAMVPAKLKPHGAVVLEIGASQAAAVSALARAALPNATIRVHRDLAGLDRVLAIVLP